MQALRRAHWLRQLVLVWVVLFVGASAASPIVRPSTMQLLCTASGMTMVMVDSDGQLSEPAPSGMNCPLCSSFAHSLPPPEPLALTVAPQAGAALLPVALAQTDISPQARPPLPPRGPPLSLL